jgi:Ca2+-binding RTX toxin-like protein
MAHFAEIGLNNTIIRVIVVSNDELLENGQESESKGARFCRNLLGGTWVQTSYNKTFRKNYAGEGYTYDSQRDAFIPPKPFASWLLDEATCGWEAPTPMPQDGKTYTWQESSTSWIEVNLELSTDNGADSLSAGSGSDVITIELGADSILGGNGADSISGGL